MENIVMVHFIVKNNISVIINNIIDNIPNGYIKIIIDEIEYNILYEDVLQSDNCSDIISLDSDDFVNNLCHAHFGENFMNNITFKNLPSAERDLLTYNAIKNYNITLIDIQNQNKQIIQIYIKIQIFIIISIIIINLYFIY